MAEDHAFLFLQVLGGDVVVEVAAELEHFARRPNRSGANVVYAREVVVELQTQLLGQRQHPDTFLVVGVPSLVALGLGRRDELLLRSQPQPQELIVQPRGGQGTGRQLVVTGHADESGDRPGQIHHALHGLNPLLPVGDAQLVDQEDSIKRIQPAEACQQVQTLGRMSQLGLIGRRSGSHFGRPDCFDRRRVPGLSQCLFEHQLRLRLLRCGCFIGRLLGVGIVGSGGLRRFRFERDVSGPPERDQHRIEFFVCLGQALGVHQTFAYELTDNLHVRRDFEHVSQQPPRQLARASQVARRGRAQLVELFLGPILPGGPPLGHFFLEPLLGLTQARVLGVFGDLVVLFAPSGDLDVVLVGQHEDVTLGVELRAAGASEDLMGTAGVHHLLLARRTFDDLRQHDRPGRQVDAGREGFRADSHRKELSLEEFLDDSPIAGQHARMVNAHAAH